MHSLLIRPLRRLLFLKHNSALKNKQTVPPVRHAAEDQLLMVEPPQILPGDAVLRTVDELQSPGDSNNRIKYRGGCRFTVFQGWFKFLGKTKRAYNLERDSTVYMPKRKLCAGLL